MKENSQNSQTNQLIQKNLNKLQNPQTMPQNKQIKVIH